MLSPYMRVFYFNEVSFADRSHAILTPPRVGRGSGEHCVTKARVATEDIFIGDQIFFGLKRKIVQIVSIASRF